MHAGSRCAVMRSTWRASPSACSWPARVRCAGRWRLAFLLELGTRQFWVVTSASFRGS